MEQLTSQDPRSYSLYFDLKIWFRARNVTGTFEKRAPAWQLAKILKANHLSTVRILILQDVVH